MGELDDFFGRQMELWPAVRERYKTMSSIMTKPIGLLRAQHNPARIKSTAARTDEQSIRARPCFLCRHNRPKEQIAMQVCDGRYELLVNPYPILPMHFTIVATEHRRQAIAGVVKDIRLLLRRFPQLTIFYNGPHCGASAPDHAHLQAGTTGMLPIQQLWGRLYDYPATFYTLGEADDVTDDDVNIVAWDDKIVVFPRSKHRPDCYDNLMVSPGAIDMAGIIVLPRREDYDNITVEQAEAILREVSC